MQLAPLHRFGIPALALGQGLSEIGFVLAVRAGFRHGDSLPLLAAILLCVALRYLFQDRGAVLEADALRATVSRLRARLIDAVRTHAVPAYRPDQRRAFERALQEHVPAAAEGLLSRRRFVGALLQCAVFLPVLLLISARMAALGLVFAALLWPVLRWRNRSLRGLESAGETGRRLAKDAREDVGASLEALPGKGLDDALRRLERTLAEAHLPEWKWKSAQARYPALIETGLFFVLAALLLAGTFTLPDWGSFLVFALVLLLAYRPVREAARHWPASVAGARALHDVESLAEAWEALPARRIPGAHPDGNTLAVRDVSFAYEAGNTVLRNVTAEFPAQGVTGITGPNGAGKTTLLRLLAGAETPDAGTVLWPAAARSRGIAYLPQRVHPGSDWADWAKHLASNQPELWGELDSLLGLTALRGKAAHPEALSGGERQRMALARTLASDAAFLLLDEPTTALPGDARERILRGALDLWMNPPTPPSGAGGEKKRGAIVVSHEPFLENLCDRTLRINAAGIPIAPLIPHTPH